MGSDARWYANDVGNAVSGRDNRLRRIQQCQGHQGVESCFVCPAYDGCDVAKEHLREERERAFEAGRLAGERQAHLVSYNQGTTTEAVETTRGKEAEEEGV